MNASRRSGLTAFPTAVTVDLEPDCPPFLRGFRGIEQGLPRLLELLDRRAVKATFFTTGEVAERYPDAVQDLVSRGHELACHGMSHRAFPDMDAAEAEWEIAESARILRGFAPVTSFRAPYLRLPVEHLSLLERHHFQLDSSDGRYKRAYYRNRRRSAASSLARIPASVTSSVLRLPAIIRGPWLRLLRAPLVLFVHPWEFVDLRRERLRVDCRFRTGDIALCCLDDVIRSLGRRGAEFVLMRDLARTAERA